MSGIFFMRRLGWMALIAFSAHGQTLYYGSSSPVLASNTVQSVSTNGTGAAVLFTASGGVNRCTAVAVDSLNSNVFLADGFSSRLWRLDLTGANLTALNFTTIADSGLALDIVNKKVYYATSSTTQPNNTVERMDYTGANNTLLFVAGGAGGNGVQRCTSLAVDTVNALIFVGDAGSGSIWSMSLGGGNLRSVVTGLAGAPLDLAVDPANQLLYYATSSATLSSNTIARIGYSAAQPAVLFTAGAGNSAQRCTSLDLDLPNAKIYFSDAGTGSLWSIPLAGSSAAGLVESGLTSATVKKVRLFAPSNLGPNAHLSFSNIVAGIPNLLGYWPFSPATQANSFGNGYTGTFQGTAAIGPAGSGPALFNMPGNTALLLNGSNSFVNTSLVGGLATNGANADQGTIIGAFNLSALPSATGRFFTLAGESMVGNDFDLQIETDNRLKFYTDGGSATINSAPFTAADLNHWIFFAATFNSNVSRTLYLNGAQVAASVPGGPHNPAIGGTFAIGASDVFGNRYFQGSIDEIAVFNRALTEDELTTLYAASLGVAFVPLNIQISGSNVVLSWSDPTSLFSLQSAPTLRSPFTNVPGATNPYVRAAAGPPLFFQLKSQ